MYIAENIFGNIDEEAFQLTVNGRILIERNKFARLSYAAFAGNDVNFLTNSIVIIIF